MAVAIPNQWAVSFNQPASFGLTPPALQSSVIALTPANSVGGGTGTPTAGNWLVAITGWNQNSVQAATHAVADDVHSFWRAGNVNTNTYAISTSAGASRVSVWYTPNLARAPLDVYVAPSSAVDGRSCLVLEISGLGPWDTVTGIFASYAAAATSLSLSLSAPASQSLIIGAVCGDSTTAGQAFAPASWTALHTVTATDGSTHVCDTVLTSAYIVTSGSVSVSGTASSATDLSGVLLAIATTGTSPVPAGQNPNWPVTKFEAAFGAGFQTPPDQMTWTDLTSRCWSWDETTGIQYQLGNIQATELGLELDNFDNNLSTDNTGGTWYPHVVSGTPVRLRCAIGTLGGVTQNRWYVIQRNAWEWPQQITEAYRRFAPVTGTDIWSATSSYGPSPYRGEVLQDSPYAWWPMDDQPTEGGVQPSSLRNGAPGNSNALNIVLSPNGATAQLVYSTAGSAPVTNNTAAPPPLIAQYATGQQSGWMFGDPQSSPFGTSATGGVVTAQPGSSAWTQAGSAGNTGSQAYFLSCNDASFPVLANGITVEGWFNFAFLGTSSGQSSSIYGGSGGDQSAQPVTALTIVELATATAAVCVLQVSSAGVLNLITYNGSTPTTHAIYSTADMRTANWHHFAITLTTTTWAVYVDGGQTATASGSATGMTSAWTYLLAAGDTGTAGGTGTASIAHSGNVSLAHLAVYPAILPAYRITAHYWAAITAFGLLPAPQGVSASMTANASGGQGNTWAGDGSVFQGTYTGTLSAATSEISALVTANAGSFTSGPSQWAPTAAIGERIFAWVTWTTGLAPLFTIYTAASHGSETAASTTIGAGDSYTSGYGSGATGTGNCHVAGGSGSSPPTGPTATGDTVGQRLERILSYAAAGGLGYGGVTSPCRCIDPSPALVQAATDIGGQQSGQNCLNVANSDSGLLFIDNLGNLTYWMRSHLAAQYSSPAWTLTPNAPPTAGAAATAIPYDRNIKISADPHRVWNSITITPFSPDGANLPLIIPANISSAVASESQYGSQPFQLTSYLQSTSEMASQAAWLLSNFGQVQVRVENLEVDAASNPALFAFILGANIGDTISVQNWAIGNTGNTGIYRISSIHRTIRFAGENGEVKASMVIMGDWEPSSYWS